MPFTYHRNRLTYGIDLPNSTGIEIGPLVNPMVRRDMSDVRYVDRASTEELREWYSNNPTINVDDIMHIDYIWGEQSLAEATGSSEQFDYCIASHVIEHIPDLITWLGEIASILKVGGIACFAVPDKRYTFDYLRPVTTTADLVDNYLNKLRKPSFKHIYDHFANFAELDITTAWSEGFDGSGLTPINTSERVYNICRDAQENEKYIDSHCSVFTQESFFALLRDMSAIGLLDFKVNTIFSTRPGMFEFFVQLEKIDTNMDAADKLAEFDRSYDDAYGAVLEIDFISDAPCLPRVYYDMGQGFSETDTLELQYHHANKPQTLRFNLPVTKAAALRFDPANSDVSFTINDVSYSVKDQKTDVGLSSISPLMNIEECRIDAEKLVAKSVKGAVDPALLVTL